MNETQRKILQVAEELIQKKGYHAFSYHDIANLVQIKKASIHYYYRSKEDLVLAVIEWQKASLSKLLSGIVGNSELHSMDKLNLILKEIIDGTFGKEKRMCLGGMLALNSLSLSKRMNEAVQNFFENLFLFLERVCREGQERKVFSHMVSPSLCAKRILVLLEGALLFARLYEDEGYLEDALISIRDQLQV